MPAKASSHRRCQSVRWFILGEGIEPTETNGVTCTVPSPEQPKKQRTVRPRSAANLGADREGWKRRLGNFAARTPKLEALTADELPNLFRARTPKQEVLTADERLQAPSHKELPLSSAPAKLVSAPACEEHRAAGVLPFFTTTVESPAEVQTRLRPSCLPELTLSSRSPSLTTPSTKTSL